MLKHRTTCAARLAYWSGVLLIFLAARTTLAQTWEEEVLADNPLSWWRLDEPAGSTVFADSGSVGLDLTATTGLELAGDLAGDDGLARGNDFFEWQRKFPAEFDAQNLSDWQADYGIVPAITAGVPSLPALGSAIDTTLGHIEGFDDAKGGVLAISTRQGSTPISDFTYEAWVLLNQVDVPLFASIGGNSVNGNPDGASTPPPDPDTGLIDQYGTRICASTDLDLFCGGLTGVRLIDESGTELLDVGTAQGQPTKDLHFQQNEFGQPEDQRLAVQKDQWYYIVAQWSEEGFNEFGAPNAGFKGSVYWKDDEGVIHEIHRDHGSNFDFGQIRLPDPGTGLLGFAIGAQALSGDFNFPGLISEFAVYGEVLDEDRLDAHFMAGIAEIVGAARAPEPTTGVLLLAGLFAAPWRRR